VLGALAGLLYGALFGSAYPYIGQQLALKGIVVVMLAGPGNIIGCLPAGMALGLLEGLAVAGGFGAFRDVIPYGGLILVMLVRPRRGAS
jgi:branched-chain amino acid transport system permease protein